MLVPILLVQIVRIITKIQARVERSKQVINQELAIHRNNKHSQHFISWQARLSVIAPKHRMYMKVAALSSFLPGMHHRGQTRLRRHRRGAALLLLLTAYCINRPCSAEWLSLRKTCHRRVKFISRMVLSKMQSWRRLNLSKFRCRHHRVSKIKRSWLKLLRRSACLRPKIRN